MTEEIPPIKVLFSDEFKARLRILAKRYRSIRTDLQPLIDDLQIGKFIGDQNTTIVFKLIDNTIAATFALLNIAVFEANFKDSVAYSWYLIADEFAYLKVI
ncbi:MAG: hypothetical protein ACKO90_40765, partial [Microcystis panniformis]